MSRSWDAYKVLTIANRHDESTNCIGSTKLSKRCRWPISDASYQEIRAILHTIEQKPPDVDALYPILQNLAPLCLCQERHQYQARQVIARWKTQLSSHADEQSSSQSFRLENESLERKLREEVSRRESLGKRVEELSEQLVKQREKCSQWIESCSEAEAAKERVLVLANKRGKEVAKAGREVERLEKSLAEKRRELEDERRRAEDSTARQVQTVSVLQAKLDEQHRISKQLVESLEELRKSKAEEATETEELKAQLAGARHASEGLQRELDASVKLNSEQGALAVTQASAHAEEVGGLRARISELETHMSLPFPRKFARKIRRGVKGFGASIGVPGSTMLVVGVVEREKK